MTEKQFAALTTNAANAIKFQNDTIGKHAHSLQKQERDENIIVRISESKIMIREHPWIIQRLR